MPERWLSVDEIAAHLGVNPETIYKWITRKSMPAHKLGRLWKFLASEVDQWVKGGHAAEDVGNETEPTAKSKKPTKH
jgi:excisionase family DNA binding protein